MKKHCTRKQRVARAPTLVAYFNAPEVSLTERLSVAAISGGWAQPSHFDNLLDCADMLLLGAHDRKDDGSEKVADVARIALFNIRERYKHTGKIGATGEELKALNVLVDVSEDFWKRKSGALFESANNALERFRAIQRESA